MKGQDLQTPKQKFVYTKCNNPYIIFNKSSIRTIAQTHHIYVDGHVVKISPHEIDKLTNDRLPAYFRHLIQLIKDNHDYITKCRAITLDGTTIPLFYLVPCRKCPYCLHSRSRDMQTRAMCENMTSSTPPLAILLTYNNENLPADGVSKDDVDRFLKRLRIALQRDGYTAPLRFLLVSEYGSKRGRAHYHAILWNFPQFHTNKYANYKKVKDYLEKYWQKGFCSVRYTHDGEENTSSHATHYFTKYVYKGSQYSDKVNPTFIKTSRRPGLGSYWLELNEHFYLQHTDTRKVVIHDKWSNITYENSLPRYFIDKLFPSVSRLVPKFIRDCFKLFNRINPSLIDASLYDYLKEKYWFMPQYTLPYLSHDFVEHFPINTLIPEQNELKQVTFTSLNQLINKILYTLFYYEPPPTLTDWLMAQKRSFAENYFDTLDANKIELHNMTRYEYHDFQNALFKINSPRLADEQ